VPVAAIADSGYDHCLSKVGDVGALPAKLHIRRADWTVRIGF